MLRYMEYSRSRKIFMAARTHRKQKAQTGPGTLCLVKLWEILHKIDNYFPGDTKLPVSGRKKYPAHGPPQALQGHQMWPKALNEKDRQTEYQGYHSTLNQYAHVHIYRVAHKKWNGILATLFGWNN